MKIFKNAQIYTANDNAPWVNTIAYADNKIVYAGNDWKGEGEIIDLSGKTVIPGFIDSHIHPGMCTKSAWHVRLPWTENTGELLDFIKSYAEEHPKEEMPFLYFEYYPTCMFDKKGPRKELLDEAVSDRPVLCQDFGEHLCWVNSKMLELLKVDKDTPDPSNLEIFVRDDAGEPTGWIKEMAWVHFAKNMFGAIGWHPPEKLTSEQLSPFFAFMHECGIIGIFDGFIESDKQIQSIYDLDKAGKLNLYYDGSVRMWSYEDLPEKIAKLREYQKKYTTEHIKVNTIKLFLDGTNESGNSASLHEHINDPGNYGEIMMETDELTKCFLLCNKEGLDLHIHMVGDRAFRVGCDAVEEAQKAAKKEGYSWVCQPVFAHCEAVDPSDMGRPARLGITVNWSCHWSGGYFGEEAMNYYTQEKWRRMYQFNSMIKSGALVAFSSDVVTNYELHRAYPFFGMQVAATRIDPEFPLDAGRYPQSMRPEESAKLDIRSLMKGYTLNGARQLRLDDKAGSLEPGKFANMCIISANPFETPADQLKEIKIDAVIFEGEIIHGGL